MPDSTHKVAFELIQDEGGYPPVSVETLWASRIGPDRYRLDNIPFYARGVSSEDIVRTEARLGCNVFQEVTEPSTNSVFRIYVSEVSDVPAARALFKNLGCQSELSDIPNLFAIDVPGNVPFGPVGMLLEQGLDQKRWEYEEACLRHAITE